MKKLKQYLKDCFKAQTAIELAVFGSIVIFIFGMIVKQSVGIGYQQNQNLKAMRLAMATSYRASEAEEIGRNTASIFLIEDRLGVGVEKYGAADRTPYVNFSSATVSRNLYMSLDWEDETDGFKNIPRLDVFVNGQHFVFTTAKLESSIFLIKLLIDLAELMVQYMEMIRLFRQKAC